jgi:hypothetical protein
MFKRDVELMTWGHVGMAERKQLPLFDFIDPVRSIGTGKREHIITIDQH